MALFTLSLSFADKPRHPSFGTFLHSVSMHITCFEPSGGSSVTRVFTSHRMTQEYCFHWFGQVWFIGHVWFTGYVSWDVLRARVTITHPSAISYGPLELSSPHPFQF